MLQSAANTAVARRKARRLTSPDRLGITAIRLPLEDDNG
jgi:hypothetical protein